MKSGGGSSLFRGGTIAGSTGLDRIVREMLLRVRCDTMIIRTSRRLRRTNALKSTTQPNELLPRENVQGNFNMDPISRSAAADNGNELAGGTMFPIVGVGASAGGLEAFTQLLQALPADTGMAFVLVQHLAPSHRSALSEILARVTTMPVMEVQDEPNVEPNHVYVIPPDRSMIIAGGKLQLLPRASHGAHHPIDQFFRTLAEEQRHQAIGVVLSGTATDGTIGLGAIKAEGGITFAQDATAQHEGMPHSAIASGCVDFVLSPDKIASEINRIARHPYAVPERADGQVDDKENLSQVLQLLRHATGVDFSGYKFNTLYRRVMRRMVFQRISELAVYVRYLRQTPAEVDALYQDILISVTSFFRDKDSFEALKSQVFPRLLKGRSHNEPVRIWTLGCSTGQEAYSLAMAFTEAAEAAGSSATLQLFASDLNAAGIDTARAGVYPKDIAQDVSPERLRRFFSEVDGHYRISRAIRDACVFSRHNVLSDPPFSRIDLISCRNLLIYMEPVLQQRIMPTLHYALKPTGYLWLGGAETIGTYRNLFHAEDAKHKIYSKKPGSGPGQAHFPLQSGGARRSPFTTTPRPADAPNLHREADRVLLTKFAPPGVLVSADLDILQYRGDTGLFLTPAPGKASLSLPKMLREGLLVPIQAAILRAGKEGGPVREVNLRVKANGDYHEVAVEVIPITSQGTNEGGFLILFEDNSQSVSRDVSAAAERKEYTAPSDAARLTQELTATREYLQSVIEQQEAANEELQSANEEVQSANEELQSTNEELETSKEEIQSSNEELATVNDELNNRNGELNRVNDDLVNLLGSVHMAIVMLGPDLRIRRFTPMAEKLLNLLPTDVGRPLADIRLNLEEVPDLRPLLTEVMDTVSIKELDVQDRQGHWYSLRLRPYRTLDNKIDGVVVLLLDVDAMKRTHDQVRESEVRFHTLFELGPVAVYSCDVSGVIREFNRRAAELWGRAPAPGDTDERFCGSFRMVRPDGSFVPHEQCPMAEVLSGTVSETRDAEVLIERPDGSRVTVIVNIRPLKNDQGEITGAINCFYDITARKQAEEELSQSDRRKSEFLAMLAHELRNPLAPIRNALAILRLADGKDEAIESASEMMERQVGQMVRMVDDLLDVSRISRGKIALRTGRVELASTVHHAVEAARGMYESMDQELTVSVPPEPIYVEADPTRLAQVVGNLLTNACKFTDKAGHISLSVAREADQAIIRVRDSGIGMAAEQLPSIFDMFTQIDTSLERSVSGLGIGLTLVKNIVELHGGSVEVRSAGAGQGSEFVVRLPIMVEDGKPHPLESSDNGSAKVAPRRILVVDDNRDSANSLAMLLKMTGHEMHTAHDGLEALHAAEQFHPNVILLDIGLPKLNGYEVARRIREQPWGQGMVIVALTGWGQDEDRQRSAAAGFDGHMVKPVELPALMTLLAGLAASTA
jgi:two-component system, chemotaxis family, CheB/CheR fusion protein